MVLNRFRGQTRIEKIVQNHLSTPQKLKVYSGDYVSIKPHIVMTHDNTAAVISKFSAIKAKSIASPKQCLFTLDHDIQNSSPVNLEKYRKVKAFADRFGIDSFAAGDGIGHQICIENCYAYPNTLSVASDSHSNMYGGIGALGTPIVRSDALSVWTTSQTWWQIPPITRLKFTGSLPKNVSGKDVVIALCGYLNLDQVLNHAIEFCGSGVSSLSIDDRLTIANMTTEWGAVAGVFPVDDCTLQYYNSRPGPRNQPKDIASIQFIEADPDAQYFQEIVFDLSTCGVYVCGPDTVKAVTPISSLPHTKIQKAYLVSCVNSRLSDIKTCADILHGKKVHPDVEFYIAAASKNIQHSAEESGYWKILLDAGAIPLPSGCGPCIGLGSGTLKDGEVGISATNRNYKGRMGSRLSKAYLSSPAVVAHSAIHGFITYPTDLEFSAPQYSISPLYNTIKSSQVEIIDGFQQKHMGKLVFVDKDNMDTDGIYAGKYTYKDSLTPAEMAQVSFEHYDPDFAKNTRQGDVIVSGFNFGTGSSREQAVTCLIALGVKCIIAGSFSDIYKRNAINNGLVCIESPDFVNFIRKSYGGKSTSVHTGKNAQIDYSKCVIEYEEKEFNFVGVGKAAQELIIKGGLEKWVKSKLE